MKSKLYSIIYIALVVIANMATIYFKPISLLGLLVPPSSWFMGFTFLLINLISRYESRRFTNSLIWVGLFLTSVICFAQNLSQSIVVASGVAFVSSQKLSTVLFTYWRRKTDPYGVHPTQYWINPLSSFIGSTTDAAIWIILGLSPLGIGSVTWWQVPAAIVGQVVVQGVLQAIASKLLK